MPSPRWPSWLNFQICIHFRVDIVLILWVLFIRFRVYWIFVFRGFFMLDMIPYSSRLVFMGGCVCHLFVNILISIFFLWFIPPLTFHFLFVSVICAQGRYRNREGKSYYFSVPYTYYSCFIFIWLVVHHVKRSCLHIITWLASSIDMCTIYKFEVSTNLVSDRYHVVSEFLVC